MYTNLIVDHSGAVELYRHYYFPGWDFDSAATDMEKYFESNSFFSLKSFDARVFHRANNDEYAFSIKGYHTAVPRALDVMELKILRAEILRSNIKPTRAIPGYYQVVGKGSAVVETVADKGLFVQNITVVAPSLDAVISLHQQLCKGELTTPDHTFE